MPLGSCACQNAQNKIQFNGVGGLRTLFSLAQIEHGVSTTAAVHRALHAQSAIAATAG
jgi:hypothetical protein